MHLSRHARCIHPLHWVCIVAFIHQIAEKGDSRKLRAEKGRDLTAPALFYVLAVLLCYLLKCFVCSPHVLSRHHGMDFDDGTKFKKERFYDSWNLGNVVHVDYQIATSATVYVRKVGRFWFDVIEYR